MEIYHHDTQKYCDLINLLNHSLSLDSCIRITGFWNLDSQPLHQYLVYIQSHPLLQDKSNQIKELGSYHSYLLKLETRSLLLDFFEQEITELKPESNWAGTKTHLYPILSECSCHGHGREVRTQFFL